MVKEWVSPKTMRFKEIIMRKALSVSALLGSSVLIWKNYKICSEQNFLSKALSIPMPSSILSTVMRDHGYNSKQQVGLMALLDINGISTDCYFRDYQTANDWLKDSTQKLLRCGERWSLENVSLEENLKKQKTRLLHAADLLGMLSPIKPKSSFIEKHIAVLPGALEARVNARILIINEALGEGLPPQKVIAATGYRKLLNSECPLITKPEARTETNMILHAWKIQSQKNPGLSQLPFELSVAELIPNQARSTAEDTARKLVTHPGLSRQNVLVYIEQPYASRFYPIFQSALQGNDNHVFLYAKGLNPEDANLFLFQDEVARRIYFQYPTLQLAYQAQDDLEDSFAKARLCGNF